jgi:hypothetical protein
MAGIVKLSANPHIGKSRAWASLPPGRGVIFREAHGSVY